MSLVNICYSGLGKGCLLQNWSWRRLYGSQASQADHSILTACSILSPSQPPYPPCMEYNHLESKMAKASNRISPGRGPSSAKRPRASGVRCGEKSFFSSWCARCKTFRPLAKAWPGHGRNLESYAMYSKVIFLPTQSPHVCGVLGGPHDFCWHSLTLRLTR